MLRRAGIQVKAAFQYKNGFQAVAKILRAAQAPTRAGQAAGVHAVNIVGRAGIEFVGGGGNGANMVGVLHVYVRHAVQRHAALCVCAAGADCTHSDECKIKLAQLAG